MVDATVFEGRDGGVEAAAGAQVGGDSLLGWGGGVGVLVAVILNSLSLSPFDFAQGAG